jgi:putative aldouronate transport system permease protein
MAANKGRPDRAKEPFVPAAEEALGQETELLVLEEKALILDSLEDENGVSVAAADERAVFDAEKNYWKRTGRKVLKHWRLYLMFLPLFLIFLFWRYFPLYGLLGAFKINNTTMTEFDREFVGLKWFSDLMFGASASEFWLAFRNTFMLSFYGLLFGFPVPIILALFFNEVKNDIVRSGFQILTYLPKFVSTVVVTTIISLLLKGSSPSSDAGVLAGFLKNLGWIDESVMNHGVLRFPKYFRAIFIISGIWEAAGYGSIVFFASIIMIPQSRYEAATIDGANKMAQILYVVLPGMASTIIIMLVLRIGELLNVGYEKVLLLQDSGSYTETNIVSTFVFRRAGMESGAANTNQALASAADLIAALLSMVLVIGSNFVSKKISKVSLY